MSSTTSSTEYRTESQGHTVITISVVFGVLTIIVMFLRLFARLFVVRAMGLDDYLMVFASLLSWAFIIATILAVKHGLGDHIEVVLAKGDIVTYAQIVWVSSIFYNACLGFIKTSVLALYARLGDHRLRMMALVMIGIIGCQATANVLTCIFQCDPIPAAWDTTITKKKCVNVNAFYLANAATNIATDLITYILPWNLVRKLQVPVKQKMAVGAMLGLGLFACVSSIIRITFIPNMLSSPDSTWVISGAMYWSVIETNIGILAASIPSFKSVIRQYLPKILGEYSSATDNKKASGGMFTHPRSGSNGFSRLTGHTQSHKLNKLSHPSYVTGRSDLKDHSMITTVTAVDNDFNDRHSMELTTHVNSDASSADDGHHQHSGTRHSNSSEERIIKPQPPVPQSKSSIMKTMEITTTVEQGGPGGLHDPTSPSGNRDFYLDGKNVGTDTRW